MKNRLSAFTFAEAFMAITILLILSAILFFSVDWLFSKSKDAKKITDLSEIKSKIVLSITEKNLTPKPNDNFEVIYSWALLWRQWVFWEENFINVWLSKPLKDPEYDLFYTYSVTDFSWEFELAAVLQDGESLNNGSEPKSSKEFSYITWDYNKHFVRTKSWTDDLIIASPSIVSSEQDNSDFQNIIWNDKIVLNMYWNFPANYSSKLDNDWTLSFSNNNFLVYNWDLNNLNQKSEQTSFITNLQNSIIYFDISDDRAYKSIKNVNVASQYDVTLLMYEYINNKMWWLPNVKVY